VLREHAQRRDQGPPEPGIFQRAEGSGVLVKHDGDTVFAITNSHVVLGADRVSVTLQSGRSIPVTRDNIYADRETDLAVLRLDGKDMQPVVVAEFGDLNEVDPGDWAVAIGSPFGLKQSITAGIISAKGRVNLGLGTLDDVELIQTDAAINPGNSGGPLLDTKGRIIGINTVIFSRNGGFQGVGFAIPVTTVVDVFEKLVKPPHKVVRGYMGILMEELSKADAGRLQIAGGVRVRQVQPGYPADKGGLEPGDIILRFNDREVTSLNQLRRAVMDTPPESRVHVGVLRLEADKRTPLTLEVIVMERPAMNLRPQLRP
jgi:S1-C subfamily serine protease